jgi:hypothetical protein
MSVYIPPTGDVQGWISAKFATLAELLHDYDHSLELRWIPPNMRTRDDKKPYVIVDTHSNTPVMYASELDIPEEILAHLFTIDCKNGDVLTKLEAFEASHRAFKAKEEIMRLEESHEQAKFFVQSPLNYLKFNGKKFDDQRRVIGSAVDRKYL